MKKFFFFFTFALILSAWQIPSDTTYKIFGTITDESGQPLIGASVLVKNTKHGTVTDFDGTFSIISADSCLSLVVTYTGYEEKEVPDVCAGKPLEIVLAPVEVLEEVVVIGYGKQRKKETVSGSVVNSMPGAPAATMGIVSKSMMAAPAEPNYNTEDYDIINENRFLAARRNPLSTFSIDVDAASYSNLRRYLNDDLQPPKDAVRIEEMVNYFDYEYPQPQGEHPFTVITELSECPWAPQHQLLHIGLQGRQIPMDELPASNLVFLVDVSGSMNDPNKLPLLVSSFKLLTDQLRPQDKVAIVVYAGAAGVVLEPTSGKDQQKIKDALSQLSAGGSTAGGAGIQLAYKIARDNFVDGGNNRVILATDGDFNIGASSDAEMVRLIEEQRKSGVFLTVLGFGMGNYKDNKMQKLADTGNGNHAYIDNIDEARKVLVSEFGGTMYAIAKDVKLQLEFNPAKVQGYRLIGYENRLLNQEDFNDDRKDAGELGSGHTVTALYEIIPVGVQSPFLSSVDELKYQETEVAGAASPSNELLTLKLRYKKPDGDNSKLIEEPVMDEHRSLSQSSDNFRWAAAVAQFGMLLRDSEFKGAATYDAVKALAKGAKGKDPNGYRAEFVKLVETMEGIASGLEAKK